MKMASNLISARALIKADLEHARHVMALWSEQVSELEKALAQLDVVGDSREALRGEYQGQRGKLPALTGGDGAEVKIKRGRKPRSAAPTSNVEVVKPKKQRAAQSAARATGAKAAGLVKGATGDSGKTAKKRTQSKNPMSGIAKYQDPDSGKTWTGHGRRPRWMVGAPQDYLIAQGAGIPTANAAQRSRAVDTEAVAGSAA